MFIIWGKVCLRNILEELEIERYKIYFFYCKVNYVVWNERNDFIFFLNLSLNECLSGNWLMVKVGILDIFYFILLKNLGKCYLMFKIIIID